MSALKYFKELIFLICIIVGLVEPKKKYPNIQDVVSFSNVQIDSNYIPRVIKQIKSSIDIEELKSNDALLRREIRQTLDDVILRNGWRDARRQVVYKGKGNNEQDKLYRTATQYQFRSKILDSMLQIVYMARHYMKIFERKEFLDRESTVYRIGYISHVLKVNYKKSVRILEILNIRQRKLLWGNDATTPALTLHHKVAKMMVDFNYYYEVLKRFHAKVNEYSNLPREKPPPKKNPQVW